jgi:hypothetical protein
VVTLGQEKTLSSHTSGGCGQLCLGSSAEIFWQLLFLLEVDHPLLEFASLFGSQKIRSWPLRTQFSIYSVNHLLHDTEEIIIEVVVNK